MTQQESKKSIAKAITRAEVRDLLVSRAINAEKRDFGHTLIIGGSYGMIGAVMMSALAALRSGAGLVSILAPRCGYTILQSTVPEAMIVPSKDEEHLHVLPKTHSYQQLAVGPGIGKHPSTTTFIDSLLALNRPLLIDADALNIIAENRWQKRIPVGSLVTPNARESERLFAHQAGSVMSEQLLSEKAQELATGIVLKGAGTLIALPDGSLYKNTTGNPGMAKGGSGDVLTGIIAGLWSRHGDLYKAAITGVYLHGLAGDIAEAGFHIESMLPTDLISCLPEAFKRIDQS